MDILSLLRIYLTTWEAEIGLPGLHGQPRLKKCNIVMTDRWLVVDRLFLLGQPAPKLHTDINYESSAENLGLFVTSSCNLN